MIQHSMVVSVECISSKIDVLQISLPFLACTVVRKPCNSSFANEATMHENLSFFIIGST